MLALLPVAKWPIFVWGAVLALVMGYLGIHDDSHGPAQLIDFLLVLGGLAAFIFDVRKRLRASASPPSPPQPGA